MDGSATTVRNEAAPQQQMRPTRLGGFQSIVRDQFDLRELFAMLRRRRGIILGSIAIITILATLVVLQLTPRYTAQSVILLDTRKTNIIDMQAVVSGIQPETYTIRSEVDVLRSRQLITKVIEKLGLEADPNFNKELRDRQQGFAMAWVSFREQLNEWLVALGLKVAPPRSLALTATEERQRLLSFLTDQLVEDLAVITDGRSYTIYLQYTAEDPVLASRVVNTLAELYLVEQLDAKFEATRRANSWLNERLAELRDTVRASEQAVQVYREQNKLTAADARGTTVTTQQLGELNTQLVLASTDRAQKEARLRQFQQAVKSGTLEASAPEVLANPLIQRLREQEAQVVRREAELGTRFGDRHPEIVNVRADLRDLRRKIAEEINKIVGNLSQEVQIARIRESSLQQNLSDLQRRTAQNNAAEVRLRELEREAQANRTLYESFLQRFKETTEQEDIQQADARIIATADVPLNPSFPNKKLFVALALVGSAMIGILLAVIIERLDNGFRTAEQLESLAGVSGLGMVPALPTRARLGSTPEDFVLRKPTSSFAESIRSIRTAIVYSHVDRPPRALLVTSAVPEEGKSLISVSLARSAAKAGQKVLLIDADLRRPKISKTLGGRSDATLAELFAGQKTAEEVLNVDEESGLHFICARPGMPNPQDLLGSQHMRDFIRSVSQHYDLVVIDSPPVLAASDSLVLSRIVDSTVFVVRWEHTPRQVVLGALKQLQNVGGNLAGVVLSRVNVKKHAKFGYGDHGYYYGKYKEYAA